MVVVVSSRFVILSDGFGFSFSFDGSMDLLSMMIEEREKKLKDKSVI